MIKNKTVSLTSIVSQGGGNIVSDMDGEKVMLCIAKGKYYNLGEIGGAIWELIEKPIQIEKVVETLLSQYDVDRAECLEQVLAFLGTLSDEGLIEVN